MAASEFDLVFLFLALFLGSITLIQYLAKRLQQPEVLGEVALGFILGPSLLGLLILGDIPQSSLASILSIKESHIQLTATVMNFLAEFAILLLLFKVGLEINVNRLKQVGASAFSAALGGIIVPLLSGITFFYLVLSLFSDLILPVGKDTFAVALFLGAALTATSIGISTRIFIDLNRLQDRFAQTAVGAAVFDDIISVTILALTLTYVDPETVLTAIGIIEILVSIILFFVLAYLTFKYLLPVYINKTKSNSNRFLPLISSLILMFLFSYLAQILHLAPIIGAFVAGVIINNEEEYLNVKQDFDPIASIIIPIFFVSIGLQINIIPLLTVEVLSIGLLLAVTAIGAKIIGGTFGSKIAGNTWKESTLVGLAMSAKGEVTLIFATTAFAIGFFTEALFAAAILLVMVDAITVPAMIKVAVNKFTETNESSS